MTSLNTHLSFTSAILLAGGRGLRMKLPIAKQFLILKGKEIAHYSFEALSSLEHITEIVVVCDPSYQHLFIHPKVKFALPGKRRQDSVWNGILACNPLAEWVVVHDSARPFIQKTHVIELLMEAKKHGCAISAVPVKATIKHVNSFQFVEKTLDRSHLWEIHTPQVARLSLLKQGLEMAIEKNLTLTDDASAVELIGGSVKLVLGSYKNIKITTPEDLHLAQVQMHDCL